jgi:hypothetical protein
VKGTDSVAALRSQIEEVCKYDVDRLVFGTAQLENFMTVEAAGLETECTVSALVIA